MPASRVASHAYVNPLVAVAAGYFLGGEAITPRMLAASALVIASVILILTSGAGRARPITTPTEKIHGRTERVACRDPASA